MRDADEDPRRRLLLKALAAGWFSTAVSGVRDASAERLPGPPGPLPANRSIYELEGDVRVNGAAAAFETRIGPADLVETGARGRIIFAVAEDAFLLRANSRLQLQEENRAVSFLRLVTGGLLSVFGRARRRVATPTATIGIRGTGLYVESEPDRSYVCTCYGLTRLASADDPTSVEDVESRHHDAPRYILAEGVAGERIRPAPVKNHTDLELMVIEALVGRSPPFSFTFDRYQRPRREY